MTPEQFEKMMSHIEDTIRATVNGKIDKIQYTVNEYIKTDMAWKEVDKVWKSNAEPVITMGTSITGFGKVFAYIVGTIATLGGLVALFINLFTKK